MARKSVPKRQRGFAGASRRNLTEAERKLWYRLRAHRLMGCQFRRQAPLGRYIVDFVCHESKVVVEVDGGQHAETVTRKADVERTHWLDGHGYHVMNMCGCGDNDVFAVAGHLGVEL